MMVNTTLKRGLLQSNEEWAARNEVLSNALSEMVMQNVQFATRRGLEVGCQQGALTEALMRKTNLKWWGIDPALKARTVRSGAELQYGWAHELPFPDANFDCVVFANVYEHVDPDKRTDSLIEIGRVLQPGGILVGQLPNPYFPIESHSRLPFMGWLPRRLQFVYWRLSPVSWHHDFYVVTIKDLKRRAESLGYETVMIRNFNYPPEIIPQGLRWAAALLQKPMQVVPWAWQFVFRKK